ncbi:sulfatase [Aporhodopirellula aestuarii]|uniref:Sulfatase n=1 Tax=Aporhodopirellula aestuarii TaxID=2950107 RepID=A0ABT0U103_9BACT|nr:sulfatase [Aporhodopirellula aestuarii]MCM2370533.1 sulfatase [Aporhodopirellula aestuarii]
MKLLWPAVTVLLLVGVVPVAAQDQPNVVLFVVDDMGWMDSTAYGSQYYETPNMERLAEQSMRFTDAYAVPLCSPTRCSILSGQHSARHRVTSASGHQPPALPDASPYAEKASPVAKFIYPNSKNFIDPAIVTLAEVLRDAGYRTGHFGKWHLGLMPENRPDQNGFETTWECAPDPGPPSYFSPYGVSAQGRPTGQHHVGNITDGPDGEYITDRLTDEALQFVETHRDEPFFLNLWQYGVHGPWGHKEEYTAEFAKKTDPRGEQRNPIMASMLKSVDESLGRVMAKLDELGLTENTLFIFYSDNGGNVHSNREDDRKIANLRENHPKLAAIRDWRKWAGGEGPTNNAPLREGKARIYEGGQRVPLMVRWPGIIQPGTTNGTVVGAIDLYPTVLDALNVDLPADHIVDGLSFLPVLTQTGGVDREAYFTWFPHIVPAVSVRKGEWKLIRRFEPHRDYPEVRELYNLTADISETNNLAPAMPDKVRELDALIDGFIADTGALMPIPNPAYQPHAAKAARAPEAGLVPKMCTVEVKNGALVVTKEPGKQNPFLGTAQVKTRSPLTLLLQARSQAGGAGRVQWKSANQENFPDQGQVVNFQLAPGNEWQDLRIELPIENTTQIIRLYLPLENGHVEIQSLDYRDAKTKKSLKRWEFE